MAAAETVITGKVPHKKPQFVPGDGTNCGFSHSCQESTSGISADPGAKG